VSAGPLNCRELVDLITDYLERQLSPADRGVFDVHVATCPDCRTYLSQIEATRRAAGRLTEADIEPEAERALLRAFADWRTAGDRP
jgi:anti-sigma factor RsiW